MHIVLNSTSILALLGLISPPAVAAVTKFLASSTVKTVANVALCAAAGVLQALTSTHGNIGSMSTTALVAFVLSGASHQHFWKPLGIVDKIATSTSDFGLGASPANPADAVYDLNSKLLDWSNNFDRAFQQGAPYVGPSNNTSSPSTTSTDYGSTSTFLVPVTVGAGPSPATPAGA